MADEPVNEQLRAALRLVILTMFRGWKLFNDASWAKEGTPHLNLEQEEFHVRAAGEDKLAGALLSYMDYWSNDIVSAAAHLGLDYQISEDGRVVTIDENVPPAPDDRPGWYREKGEWVLFDDNTTVAEGPAKDCAPSSPAA